MVDYRTHFDSDHWRITAAGWSYRSNDRGWIIYRDPKTGCWHTRAEAIAIIEAVLLNFHRDLQFPRGARESTSMIPHRAGLGKSRAATG